VIRLEFLGWEERLTLSSLVLVGPAWTYLSFEPRTG